MTLQPIPQKRSIWAATVELPRFPSLTENIETEICVVGAGISGLTTAYLLANEGRSVVVIDDGPIAGGMTQVTTGHLVNAIDDRYYRIESWHGARGAQLAAESHTAAIDKIERIIEREGIDCDFERLDGFLFPEPGSAREDLDRELEAARRAGVDAERIAQSPIASFDIGAALRFPRQGQIHILKYLDGVARAFEEMGGRIFCKTHVTKIEGGDPAKVTAGEFAVACDAVVVATNSPINDRVIVHTKQAGYLTYVVAARVPAGSVPRALFWDTGDPYHYIRTQRLVDSDDEELLIVGGEDHKVGQADDTEQRHGRLEEWARARFPKMGKIEFVWAGQVMETVDGLAYLGRNPGDENIYIITGDSGMGLTHGTIGGLIIADLIAGRENRWASLYDPARKPLRAMGEYAKENINTAAQYGDWLTAGDVDSTDDIPNGSGAVVRRGLHKVAAYRDKDGTLHEMSAVCPHLEGIVRWNPAEQTWDCPCHGSRFKPKGEVMMGPANSNLKPLES